MKHKIEIVYTRLSQMFPCSRSGMVFWHQSKSIRWFCQRCFWFRVQLKTNLTEQLDKTEFVSRHWAHKYDIGFLNHIILLQSHFSQCTYPTPILNKDLFLVIEFKHNLIRTRALYLHKTFKSVGMRTYERLIHIATFIHILQLQYTMGIKPVSREESDIQEALVIKETEDVPGGMKFCPTKSKKSTSKGADVTGTSNARTFSGSSNYNHPQPTYTKNGDQFPPYNPLSYTTKNVEYISRWLPSPDAYVVTQVCTPAFFRPEDAAEWENHYQTLGNLCSNSMPQNHLTPFDYNKPNLNTEKPGKKTLSHPHPHSRHSSGGGWVIGLGYV